MQAIITLTSVSDRTYDQVIVEEIKDKGDFCYLDNQNCECHLKADKNSFRYYREDVDHALSINVDGKNNYIKIVSPEGEFEIQIKVIDFIFDNDILDMRYLIENEERQFRIKYQ